MGEDDEWEVLDDPECRSRMLFLFVLIAVVSLLGGMALTFLLDWMIRVF